MLLIVFYRIIKFVLLFYNLAQAIELQTPSKAKILLIKLCLIYVLVSLGQTRTLL